jgi:hypothetical protein
LRAVDRVAALFLLLLMAVGCLALWIAVPAAVLKFLSPLSESKGYHLGIALLGVPAAMISVGVALLWVNRLYLRITGGWGLDEDGSPRRFRGPLESILVWSLLVALVALVFWFFVFAENPSPQVL